MRLLDEDIDTDIVEKVAKKTLHDPATSKTPQDVLNNIKRKY